MVCHGRCSGLAEPGCHIAIEHVAIPDVQDFKDDYLCKELPNDPRIHEGPCASLNFHA